MEGCSTSEFPQGKIIEIRWLRSDEGEHIDDISFLPLSVIMGESEKLIISPHFFFMIGNELVFHPRFLQS